MDRYILDTNMFFNMAAGVDMGQKTEIVVKNFTKAIKKLKADNSAEFYMPPRVVDEMLSFFEDKNQPFLQDFLSVVMVKAPNMMDMTIPAPIFYQLIDDVRIRNYRGLTIAEEEMKKAALLLMPESKDLPKKNFELKIGPVVKTFRDRYRNATRFGFLDSVADLDLIMLSKEVDGFLVSTDEGLIKWGRIFGVKEMAPQVFGTKMKEVYG